MSDTPRTDDATWHTRTPGDPIGADVVYASFAAGLERELSTALARIKRLEEAGDELETDIKALRQIFNDMGAVVTIGNASMNGWTQAKEAR